VNLPRHERFSNPALTFDHSSRRLVIALPPNMERPADADHERRSARRHSDGEVIVANGLASPTEPESVVELEGQGDVEAA
jgi:hypothetical protein